MAASTRTQVYLTAEQRRQIDELRAHDGRTLAEVIRTALDEYLATQGPVVEAARRADLQCVLDETFGSMPDLKYPDRDAPDRFDGEWKPIEPTERDSSS